MRRSLLKAVSLNVVSQVVNAIGAVVVTAIVSRSLGPAGTGDYALATFSVLTIGSLATLGGPLVITRAIAEDGSRSDPVGLTALHRLALRWTGASTLAAFAISAAAIAGGLAGRFSATEQLVGVLALASYILSAYGSALLAGRQDFRRLLLVSAAGTLLQVALASAAVVASPDISMYLAAMAISCAFQGIACGWIVRGCFRGRSDGVKSEERKSLRRDVVMISAISIVDTIVIQRTEVFVLAAVSSSREVAFFSLASALVTRTMAFLPGAVASVMLPRFSASQDLSAEYTVAVRWSALASIPLAAWFVVCGSLIVDVLYGAAYRSMSDVIAIIAVAAIVNCIGSVAGSAGYATHTHRYILRIQGACAVLNCVLAIVLCRPYGAIGAASAGSIAQVVGVLTGIAILWWRVRLRTPWLAILRVLAVGAAATVIGFASKQVLGGRLGTAPELVVVTTAFFLSFGVLAVIARAVPEDESAALLGAIRGMLSARRRRTPVVLNAADPGLVNPVGAEVIELRSVRDRANHQGRIEPVPMPLRSVDGLRLRLELGESADRAKTIAERYRVRKTV